MVLLYADEVSIYRQPSQAWLWSGMGRKQPRYGNRRGVNSCLRVLGYLNAVTGAVHHHEMRSVTVAELVKRLPQLPRWYPAAERIYLVWDNWFNHRHPQLVAALAKCPTVKVLLLPTYAPWLNPIEKLWRWLRQTVVHAHPWADDFPALTAHITAALDGLSAGSTAILRYVGLSSQF